MVEPKGTENSGSAMGSILQNFGRCFNRSDKTSSIARFNIYKEVSCVEMSAQLISLEEVSNMRIPWEGRQCLSNVGVHSKDSL